MAAKPNANPVPDLTSPLDLTALLNSRDIVVRSGRFRIQDVMQAAQKSVAAHANTTESDPGPTRNGVTERTYQETLMNVLAAINNNQLMVAPQNDLGTLAIDQIFAELGMPRR